MNNTERLVSAIEEIEAVLEQYTKQKGIDPEYIYGIFSSREGRIVRVKVDDLRLLVDAARDQT